MELERCEESHSALHKDAEFMFETEEFFSFELLSLLGFRRMALVAAC